jgi:hypothetical protein
MVKFYHANDGKHKFVAVFDNPKQVVKFGAYGYDDFTTTGVVEFVASVIL